MPLWSKDQGGIFLALCQALGGNFAIWQQERELQERRKKRFGRKWKADKNKEK